ncbi:MAG: hypothetical protein WD181_01170 [Solirubrobacterales bacterium]
MAKQIFDQAQSVSTKAQRFAAAFEGCDEWTIPPRKQRRIEEEALFDAQVDRRVREARTEFRRAA